MMKIKCKESFVEGVKHAIGLLKYSGDAVIYSQWAAHFAAGANEELIMQLQKSIDQIAEDENLFIYENGEYVPLSFEEHS